MRFNWSGSSVALNRPVLAMALLLAVVCTLFASGNETRAQAAVPAAPTGLTAPLTAPTVAHDSVTLVWDDPGDSSITGYQVLRRSRDGDEYGDGLGAAEFAAIVDDTGSAATTYTDTSVAPRTRYVYRVKARNSHGLSEKSSYVGAETTYAPSPTSPPSMPTGLAVSSASHDSVALAWDDPGDSTIESYQVLRRSRDRSEYGDGLGSAEFVVIIDDTGSSATTYTDTSVTPRTRYIYRVKAKNPQGLSERSSYANAETPDTPQPTAPSMPTGLAVSSASHDSVTLTWDDPGDSTIESYQVLRRSRDGADYGDGLGAAELVVITDDTGSPAITYTDTSVAARTRYVYRVKARNPHGLSERSSSANAETLDAPPPTSPPSMPTGLAVSSATHDSVTLTWDDPGDSTIESYQILRRSRDGSEYGDGLGDAEFVGIIDDTGSSATIYTDTSVTPRTRYVYRVKARNLQGLSEKSSYANAETPDTPQPAPPSTPMGLAVSSASHDSVTLTWDDPGDSTIESYQILRRSRDGSEYGDGLGDAEFVVIVDDTGSPTTTYTDTSVAPRTRYVYGVKARNPHGLSGASGSANAETLEAPPDTSQSTIRGSRPNVVLILTDDLGWGDIRSNYPDSAMTTPRIDGIAAAGVNFTDAHSPSAACTGTRYGLLTGRYSWRSWMKAEVLNGYDRPLIGPDRPTLGTLLQGHGYRTAAVGKWHLGMDFARLSNLNEVTEVNRGIDFAAEIADSPIDHGFDEFFGTSANLTWHVPVYIRNNRFTAIPHGVTRPATGNIEANEVLDRLTEEAVAFIERAGENEDPFFLYLPLNAPHLPLAPNDHFNRQTDLGSYGDFVAQIDWTVGQVLDTLRRVGEHDNTIVILTSDNGSFMGSLPNDASNDHTSSYNTLKYRVGTHQSNAGWRYGKGSIYEGGHRIPFLLQWPAAIETGSAVDATVSLTDMYATLADIVGEEPAPGIAPDSVSLLPLLLGEAETRGGPVVHHSTYGTFAVRDGRWKLVFHDPRELYDLEQSPGERNNLAAAHPKVVARLEATLARIRSSEDGTLSDDATLRSLLLAGIDLGQFDPNVRTYAATVGREIATVEVIAIPTETDARAGISTPEGQLLYGKPLRGRVEVELADPATTITVRVVAADGSATVDYTVTVTRPEEPPDGPTIAGTVEVGETLTADASSISDEDGLTSATFSYQWVSDDGIGDTDIQGATDPTYTLVSADQGKTIKVRVSFTDDGGNDETLTSDATPGVVGATSQTVDFHILDAPVGENEAVLYRSTATLTPVNHFGNTHDSSEERRASLAISESERLRLRLLDKLLIGSLSAPISATDLTIPLTSVSGLRPGESIQVGADGGELIRIASVDAANQTIAVAERYQAVAESFVAPRAWPAETVVYHHRRARPERLPGYMVESGERPTFNNFRMVWTGLDVPYLGINLHFTGSDTELKNWRELLVYLRFRRGDDQGTMIEGILPLGADGELNISHRQPGNPYTVREQHLRRYLGWPEDLDSEPNGTGEVSFVHDLLRGKKFVEGSERTFLREIVDWIYADDGHDLGRIYRLDDRYSPDDRRALQRDPDTASEGLVRSYQVVVDVVFLDGTNSRIDADNFSISADSGDPENAPATGAPIISGTAQVAETLTADTSGIADEDGLDNATFSYQWVSNDGTTDTDIEDAASSTHTLDAVDEGKTIKVRVSFTDDAGNEETLTSAPTARVASSSNNPATGLPTIRGQVRVGATLRASLSALDDPDGLSSATFTYQWLADDEEIQDATDSTYFLGADDAGKTVKVRVSFTDDVGNEETLTSRATTAVEPR